MFRRHGRLDVVINNAGAAAMNHVLLTPVSTVDRLVSTNLRGTFLVCRESAKLMKKQGRGRIVNLTTVAVPLAAMLSTQTLAAMTLAAVPVLAPEIATRC